MFENIKTGFIENKLWNLLANITELEEKYNISNIKEFIPNIEKRIGTALYRECIQYKFSIDKMNYILRHYTYEYTSDDIIILVNNIKIFEESGLNFIDKYCWNHNMPKAMLNEIKGNSKVIDKYNKLIKEYMRTYNTIKKTKWMQEYAKLNDIKVGNAILINKVFNLITKSKYYDKPTYDTLRRSLETMKEQIINKDIHYLAMCKIGCGLDKLQWSRVRSIIQDVFTGLDLEILVCKL